MECAQRRTFTLTESGSRDALTASMRELMGPDSQPMDLVWEVDAQGAIDVRFRYSPQEQR